MSKVNITKVFVMDFQSKCPLCGTQGKEWNKREEIFQCPNCSSVYSKFGVVVERQSDAQEFWT